MEHVWNILGEALPAIEAALAALLSWAAIELTRWLRTKTANAVAEGILTRLAGVVHQVVSELMQTSVSELRKATSPDSPGGRQITKEEAADLKDEALSKVRSYMGPKGFALLMKVLGFVSENEANDFIKSKIEAEVHALKLMTPIILSTEGKADE